MFQKACKFFQVFMGDTKICIWGHLFLLFAIVGNINVIYMIFYITAWQKDQY